MEEILNRMGSKISWLVTFSCDYVIENHIKKCRQLKIILIIHVKLNIDETKYVVDMLTYVILKSNFSLGAGSERIMCDGSHVPLPCSIQTLLVQGNSPYSVGSKFGNYMRVYTRSNYSHLKRKISKAGLPSTKMRNF